LFRQVFWEPGVEGVYHNLSAERKTSQPYEDRLSSDSATPFIGRRISTFIQPQLLFHCFITPTLEVLRQLQSPSRMDREVLEISSLVTPLVARPSPSERWASLDLLVDRLFEKPNRNRNRTVEGSRMP
jgi:hypothetical protein